jgi:hypothetical protein
MAKTKISEFSATAANNTDIDSINIAEGCAPSGINDAIRELMAQLKDFQTGAVGDSFNGPVGTTTAAAGAFTTLSATGVTTVQAGTSSAPAITTSGDTNTGIFFPAADTIAFTEGGTEAMRIDSSGNVGIGTSSPNERMTIASSTSGSYLQICDSSTGTTSGDGLFIGSFNGAAEIKTKENKELQFGTNNTERARIDSSGNLLVGTTTANARVTIRNAASADGLRLNQEGGTSLYVNNTNASYYAYFVYNGTNTGRIETSGTTTSYVTSSDYRLKNTIAPMTGALAKVAALKPCTYKWNADGSDGEGFIAHELQEVVPECVTGEKDAVDAEGNPQYQGIDTSFLVATLTAAIQELKAINDAQATTITALTARVEALESN